MTHSASRLFPERSATKLREVDLVSYRSNDELDRIGAQPSILSLEAASVGDIIKLLDTEKPDGVVFSAGAGGKGGEERTKAVDYEGELAQFRWQSPACPQEPIRLRLLICDVFHLPLSLGALKVFDAMESSNTHRIVMVSATDLRG